MWPENRDALRHFLESTRCLALGAFGGVIGWDYRAYESRSRMLKIKGYREMLPLLEVMLDAARPILNRNDD